MLFDTHAHFDDPQFDDDRDQVIKSLKEYNVGYVTNIGADIETSVKASEISKKYDFIYATAGIHPGYANEFKDEDIEVIRKIAEDNPKVKAIGEIGLDYHYDDSDPEKQKYMFKKQLALAKEMGLPVVIHDRDSKGECLEILKEMEISDGVVHCFSGSAETAKEILKLGLMISFTGVLTFKNAKKAVEACRVIPLDRLMIETDSPYMAPEPNRGKRNFSGYVGSVAQKMAEIKGVSVEEIEQITTENAIKFYRI